MTRRCVPNTLLVLITRSHNFLGPGQETLAITTWQARVNYSYWRESDYIVLACYTRHVICRAAMQVLLYRDIHVPCTVSGTAGGSGIERWGWEVSCCVCLEVINSLRSSHRPSPPYIRYLPAASSLDTGILHRGHTHECASAFRSRALRLLPMPMGYHLL